jgi:hypothetical protein
LYRNNQEHLWEKIKSLLDILLPLVGLKYIPFVEDDNSSESDYDDDIVTKLLEEMLNGKLH